jgi:hypothetical protein
MIMFHLNGMALYGDPSLSFQIHIIQHLLLKVPLTDRICELKQSVGQRAFPMINMGNDTEVPDVFHFRKNTINSLMKNEFSL